MSEPTPNEELLEEFADRFMGEIGEGVTIIPPPDASAFRSLSPYAPDDEEDLTDDDAPGPDDAEDPADPTAEEIEAWAAELDGESVATRAAGHDTHPGGKQFRHYWTETPEGLAKWADSPHPWTALFHHLAKHMAPEMARRVAAQWFHRVFHFWPGSDLNRVTHGRPPRGSRVGPG